MKKKFVRMMALVLALVMCFCVSAVAAEITDSDKATIKDPVTGAVVTFTDTDGEKIEVTYESADIKVGQFYLVMVIADDGEGNYVPTKDTILYINQTTGVDTGKTDANGEKIGKIVFGGETALYPTTIKDSAILIYGTNVDGEANSLIAAVIDAKYILGDVNGDKEVDGLDIVVFNQRLAGMLTSDQIDNSAADINKDGEVDGRDIVIMNQYFAKIIEVLG